MSHFSGGRFTALIAAPDVTDRSVVDLLCLDGRIAVRDDIAHDLSFCASDLSSFMIGTKLAVDGGDPT